MPTMPDSPANMAAVTQMPGMAAQMGGMPAMMQMGGCGGCAGGMPGMMQMMPMGQMGQMGGMAPMGGMMMMGGQTPMMMPMGGNAAMMGGNQMMMMPMPMMQMMQVPAAGGQKKSKEADSGTGGAAFSQKELEKRLKKLNAPTKAKKAPRAPEPAPPPPEDPAQPPPPGAETSEPLVICAETQGEEAAPPGASASTLAVRQEAPPAAQAAPAAQPAVRHIGVCLAWDNGMGLLRSQKQGEVPVQACELKNCGFLAPGDMVTFELGLEDTAVKCMYAGPDNRGAPIGGCAIPPPSGGFSSPPTNGGAVPEQGFSQPLRFRAENAGAPGGSGFDGLMRNLAASRSGEKPEIPDLPPFPSAQPFPAAQLSLPNIPPVEPAKPEKSRNRSRSRSRSKKSRKRSKSRRKKSRSRSRSRDRRRSPSRRREEPVREPPPRDEHRPMPGRPQGNSMSGRTIVITDGTVASRIVLKSQMERFGRVEVVHTGNRQNPELEPPWVRFVSPDSAKQALDAIMTGTVILDGAAITGELRNVNRPTPPPSMARGSLEATSRDFARDNRRRPSRDRRRDSRSPKRGRR